MSIANTLKVLNPYNRYFLYPMQAAVNEYEQRMERKARKAENRGAGQNDVNEATTASSDTATTATAETTTQETVVNEVPTTAEEVTAAEATSEATETPAEEAADEVVTEGKHHKHHRIHFHKHHHKSSDDNGKDKKDIFAFMKKKKDEEPAVAEEAEQPAEATAPSEASEENPDKKSKCKKDRNHKHHQKNKHNDSCDSEKEPEKTEQEQAEAECPAEPVGAEKVTSEEQPAQEEVTMEAATDSEKAPSNDATVGSTAVDTSNSETEAAKSTPVLLRDNEEHDGIDFGPLGGLKVGFDLMSDHDRNKGTANPYNPVFDMAGTPISDFAGEVQQPTQTQTQFNPLFNPGIGMNSMADFTMNPMPNMNTYGNMLRQQQPIDPNATQGFNPAIGSIIQQQQAATANPIAGIGRHRTDNPPAPKKEEVKAEPTSVDLQAPEVGKPFVQQKLPKKDMSELDCISQVPKVDPVPLKSLFPGNEEFYTKYSDLRTIENIALSNGYQVCFVMRPSGLIDCFIYTAEGQHIPTKGFTIDPGHMYDGRWKIFPTIIQYYEGVPPYHMYDRNVNRGGKKVRGPLHEEFIRDLIVGGSTAITSKPMYSTEEINLNSAVALITINKPGLSNDERKFIKNRIVELYKSGAFDAYQNTRFKMVSFDKDTKTILLDNISTPKYYGAKPDPTTEPIQIKITPKNFQVLKGANMIAEDSK